jgi:3-phenylpropionate/trans-cinnamate dioxygenase ferredoxin subunit
MYNYLEMDPKDVEYIPVGEARDVPSGERLFIEVDGEPIVVFNIAGQYFAIADLCSHDDGPLGDGDLEEFDIVCPRHGARFDVRDGKALSMPAVVNIPSYPTRVVDGQIEIGLPIV